MNKYINYFKGSIYTFYSEKNILESKDLGICSNIASVRTPETSVTALECFQGCPWTNTAFSFDVRIDGERVKIQKWEWLPNAMFRVGRTEKFDVESLTAVIPNMRTFVMKVLYHNRTKEMLSVPLTVEYRGCCTKEDYWDFSGPKPQVSKLSDYQNIGDFIGAVQGDTAFWLTTSVNNMKMFTEAYLWEGEIVIPAEDSVEIYFSGHIGDTEVAMVEAKNTYGHYNEKLDESFKWLEHETARIYENLPRLTSNNPQLDTLYYRSLVTYILCRWENPELCTSPYFSTGSINGACMCSYLWDYCGGLMMHPLYDTDGNKKALLAYLKNDLTTSYALNPVTGGRVGPWYQVNQEKVICMVYYHVLFTGEKEFLCEKAGDKTVLEWMLYHAYVCDDIEKEVSLYDYGFGGKEHLELRREYVYNGIMPDLNARRYMNYLRVYQLTCIVGSPDENLLKRAAQLKEKLKSLWNEDEKWYDFINNDGKRDIRYTVQMFKFLNSPVIDKKEREGLISHLNEREFLSKFGLHSMSKLDEAYDQDDIDNGGGGICTHFTMQICAQLYEMGYDDLATDILQRVYWWGERMPYMGDSCAANIVKNREDTPLQGDISSVSCAQMIFYYIFGIRADFNGNISVSPVSKRPAENMKIENARLCGKIFSVEITGDTFCVYNNEQKQEAKIGQTIQI